ncbi:hypothetical protein BJX63DRAFT_425282 [Aspergillus granulosus]|uniref:AB hydrolase-1 domain-containing protein n=1 Tax=Aspergillus granulosus TaxID=176169 RepID=A0ABR4GWJ1_9EURO
MTSLIFVTALLALTNLNLVNAAPSSSNRPCVSLELALPVIMDSPDITDRIKGVKRVEDTFTINAQLCVPKYSEKRGILEIATHGFAFDKKYWDSEVEPEKYSYVDAALDAGYSILTYDRLGVGESSKPDAYDVVQGPVQLKILKEITLSRDRDVDIPDFNEIVLVGHSLGSPVTIGVLSQYGKLVDASIWPGTRKSHDPHKFHDRGSGYLVQATESNVQQIFFKKGYFDPNPLNYGEKIKETGTVGDFLSLGAVLANPALNYKAPLLFALAEYDFEVCAGNCTGSYDLDAIRSDMFPSASDVDVHIQGGSGHALTMHRNATRHYQAISAYLGGKGL